MKHIKTRAVFENEQEHIAGYSNCCDAPVYGEGDICSQCGEHCEVLQHDKEESADANEGRMAEIDVIGQESETKDEFRTKLKDYLRAHAADKDVAEDDAAIDNIVSTYFDENGDKL